MKELGPEARSALLKLRQNLARIERIARVLIIDDSPNDCALLERDLKLADPEMIVDIAHTKDAADQHCLDHCYDVIFLDLLMPGPTGVDLLKSSPCFDHENSHVIVLTGLETDSDLVADALSNGARVIFQKPISERQIKLIFGKIP